MPSNCGTGEDSWKSLDSKEIKPVSLKGDQPWIFTGRTEAKAEASVFWSFDANRWLTGRVPDAGKDWGQKGKRASEDEMARWHHWLQWTWTWANSGRWRRTGRPGMLQGMGSQRVRHDWVTEQQQPTIKDIFKNSRSSFPQFIFFFVYNSICA